MDLTKFKCNPNIDWYLTTVALTMHQKRLSFVTCWLDGADVAGYVATSMHRVELIRQTQREELQVEQQIMPAGTVMKGYPALLIGMLGTCDRYRRRGLGREMVLYAVGQALKLSDGVGCRFVTVDADRTEEAVTLYKSCDFGEVEQKPEKPGEERKTIWMYHDLKGRT